MKQIMSLADKRRLFTVRFEALNALLMAG